jgi:pSer/pThr/pTyr-binding forkhead associated (FHA) protein
VVAGPVALLFAFDDLSVSTLPPLGERDELIVGRQPDCDLVIDDPSASKRHAAIRWDRALARCTVVDLGSTNGTFLNGSMKVRSEMPLRDGDIVGFGEAHFWFLLAQTLHARLASALQSDLLGSRSG